MGQTDRTLIELDSDARADPADRVHIRHPQRTLTERMLLATQSRLEFHLPSGLLYAGNYRAGAALALTTPQ